MGFCGNETRREYSPGTSGFGGILKAFGVITRVVSFPFDSHLFSLSFFFFLPTFVKQNKHIK